MIEVLKVKEDLLKDNDKEAEKVRAFLKEKGVFMVNLMGSPGSGKTTTLLRTIEALKDEYRIGVLEADVDGTVDADTVLKSGVDVMQLHTSGLCHMSANMTMDALKTFLKKDYDLIILENIGNLVCPTEFDVGQDIRAMILSTPEGDDKPLKYPLMFTVSDCLLINKCDVAEVFDFDYDRCEANVRRLNKDMDIIRISSLKNEGLDDWIAYLKKKIEEKKHEDDRTA